MRTVIVGPGAIGCLFAALLTEAGWDVVLLDRDPARARRLCDAGIRVDDPAGSRTVRVPAVASTGGVRTPDAVCICVKSYDTAAAVRSTRPLLGPHTFLASLQNGLGHAEILAAAAGPGRTVCAATSHGATSLGAGHVRHAGTGPTTVAPFDRQQPEPARRFARALDRAGIAASFLEDADGMLWSKLIVNAAVNPVTALWDVPNGAILERPELQDTALAAAAEAEQVARARGVRLLYEHAAQAVTDVCTATRDNLSSMLQDLRAGRRTEVGAVVDEARRLDVPAPINRRLLSRVREREAADRSRHNGV